MTTDQWQPSASLTTLQQRAKLLRTIRQFFSVRHVLEVNTPVVVKAGVSDPHLDSFMLEHSAGYLRTSPEYAMKRLLAAGSGDIYELGPVFRQGESGRWHNPEFTMLEWYRLGWSYHQLIDEVIELLSTCSPDLLALWPIKKTTYSELSLQVLGTDIARADISHLLDLARTHGWHTDLDDTSQSILLDFIFSHLLQPALALQTINVITDFPVCQAALAKIINHNGNTVAQRFEVFLGQVELANGYQELTDQNEQMRRFIEDKQHREKLGKVMIQPDRKLLQAMQYGLPECTGVALGVERLLSVINNQVPVNQCLSFDWYRN